jgi:hypothetical protein
MNRDEIAVEVLSQQIVKAIEKICHDLPFDRTVKAKVVRKHENDDKYVVSHGGKEMVVYARGRQYSVMDTVWVLIPCNNASEAFIL